MLLGVDQTLQGCEFQRRKRSMPGAIQCADHCHELVCRGWYTPRIGHAPSNVVMATGCAHRARVLLPADHAIMPVRHIVVTRLANEHARISD